MDYALFKELVWKFMEAFFLPSYLLASKKPKVYLHFSQLTNYYHFRNVKETCSACSYLIEAPTKHILLFIPFEFIVALNSFLSLLLLVPT